MPMFVFTLPDEPIEKLVRVWMDRDGRLRTTDYMIGQLIVRDGKLLLQLYTGLPTEQFHTKNIDTDFQADDYTNTILVEYSE